MKIKPKQYLLDEYRTVKGLCIREYHYKANEDTYIGLGFAPGAVDIEGSSNIYRYSFLEILNEKCFTEK